MSSSLTMFSHTASHILSESHKRLTLHVVFFSKALSAWDQLHHLQSIPMYFKFLNFSCWANRCLSRWATHPISLCLIWLGGPLSLKPSSKNWRRPNLVMNVESVVKFWGEVSACPTFSGVFGGSGFSEGCVWTATSENETRRRRLCAAVGIASSGRHYSRPQKFTPVFIPWSTSSTSLSGFCSQSSPILTQYSTSSHSILRYSPATCLFTERRA
jgi:hypothetical protein